MVTQRWVIPIQEISLGVEELLPQDVAVQNGSFEIGVDPASVSASLGDLCDSCESLDGTYVSSMPPFNGQIETTQGLLPGVEGAVVSGGSLEVTFENGFAFDPIEGGGTVTLSITDASGGDELAGVVMDGTTDSLPSGSTVHRVLPINPGAVGSTLGGEAEIVSVGGQSATIDVSEEITLTLSEATLLVSSITFDAVAEDVTFGPTPLDAEGFDASLTDRIREGAIILDVANPFAVSVDADLVIGSTTRSFAIGSSGPSTVNLEYTGDELRSFLGQPDVTLSWRGTATGESVTVTPEQEIVVEASLDLTLEIGGDSTDPFVD